ncbi:glycoside hydrolase family 24 [Rhizobium sp. Root708]|uniref:TIGR02217 family protein n=1 Tax=Rhizobium sp. Root708 TaxID=1736592 RepID=UPI0007016D2D|nr:TIGR02217 family protein [Rhizobium sp. Root708]KRB50173.1 glycoside hydrolase family 24 [Rhizobium sp. Root708]
MANGFHEVRFPLRLSLSTSGGPIRRTDIVNLSNGRESRNSRWRDARRSYDAGSGLRSVADLYEVLEFFEARSGELHGFRFRDPVDWISGRPGMPVSSMDQPIGTGDGVTANFTLTKTYKDAAAASLRRIFKPVAGSVVVAVGGVPQPDSAFISDPATGIVSFAPDQIPPPGALISAGYEFDVPVRFATGRIDINLSAFNAGRIPTIPLTEIVP